jgi:hypothetical protein
MRDVRRPELETKSKNLEPPCTSKAPEVDDFVGHIRGPVATARFACFGLGSFGRVRRCVADRNPFGRRMRERLERSGGSCRPGTGHGGRIHVRRCSRVGCQGVVSGVQPPIHDGRGGHVRVVVHPDVCSGGRAIEEMELRGIPGRSPRNGPSGSSRRGGLRLAARHMSVAARSRTRIFVLVGAIRTRSSRSAGLTQERHNRTQTP